MWKKVKFTSERTRHFNVCKSFLYLKPPSPYELLQHKSHNKKNILDGNWKDESDLLSKTVTTVTANGIFKTPTENTPRKRLLASEFLSTLREKWFCGHEFLNVTLI